MSAARLVGPNDQGRHLVECKPCDASEEFVDLAQAVFARKLHLCVGEVPSCSWVGWTLGTEWEETGE